MERDRFLARVGQATLRSQLPASPRLDADLPSMDEVDLVALFRARAQEVNAVVHGPVSRHGVPRAVVGIAAGHEASTFASWDDLPAPGVASALQSAGLDRLEHEIEDNRLERNLSFLTLDVGVTGSAAALAESGSVVLVHGPGRARMASIAPEVHIALLDVTTVSRTLAHWAHENPGFAADTTNLVLVTGPSRTGDIELQLNLGVHGPRHVHVVMIR